MALGECARTVNPSARQLHLPDMVGSELGSTICFGFHEKYLYDFAKHTSFEVEEIDWTSFYHSRFPNSLCKAVGGKTEERSMWRRQY
jgi:hypothetical protein